MTLNWLKGGSSLGREVRKLEPGIASLALEHHWTHLIKTAFGESQDPEAAITVISHFNQMLSLLKVSRDDRTSWLNCKSFWIKHGCSHLPIKYLYDLGAQRCDKDDLKLVYTLQSFLELASEDGQLLGYFISTNDNDNSITDPTPSNSTNHEHTSSSSTLGAWDGACSLSSLLLDLCVSLDARISESARKSFVLLIQLASKYPELESSISEEARVGVTNMTISHACACFSQLPTFNVGSMEQLRPFIDQLHFIDCIVEAASEALKAQIADCFSKNFLYAVILPALTQDEGSRSLHARDDQKDYVRSLHEEIATVTCYLQICCETLTQPHLVKSIVSFVLNQLLTTLLHRMNHPSTAVTISTLSLLNSLLQEFYCENIYYELICRHIISQDYLMVSERHKRLPEINFQESALRFVSLLPTCVTDVVSVESISYNFHLYLQDEMIRWCAIDRISHSLDAEEPDVAFVKEKALAGEKSTNSSKCNNSVYPNWRYKYDGTDRIESSSPPSSTPPPPELCHQKGNETQLEDPSSPVLDPLGFSTVSLQGGINTDTDDMNSIGIGISESSFEVQSGSNGLNNSNNNISKRLNDTSINDESDGYHSLEVDHVASFGPFLDILFTQLMQTASLDTDVLLCVTQLVSTLASSRIPLISSLLLDHNLTLQPAYRSFLQILNRVRLEFEKSLRNQQKVITEVWGQLCKEQARLEQESGVATSVHPSFKESGALNFTENLKSKINSNFGAAVSAFFQRKSIPGPSSSVGNISEQNQPDTVQSSSNQGYRYKTGRPGSAESRRDSHQESNRIMATRAIYFTHWLLELSAIATQLCWTRHDS